MSDNNTATVLVTQRRLTTQTNDPDGLTLVLPTGQPYCL